MVGEYGRNVIGNTGIPVFLAANEDVESIPVGVSLDWSTVAAAGSTFVSDPEGVTIQAGQKYLPMGQVITRITNKPVQTLTLTNVTGGTFALSGYRLDTGAYVNTGPLAYNISAADLAAALNAYTAFGPTPTSSVTLAAGPPVVYTVTSPVGLLAVDGSLLTGSSPSAATAVTVAVGNYGRWGPFDPNATDGRQTLATGQCAVLNTLVLQNGVLGLVTFLPSNHPTVIVGGQVWTQRLKANAAADSLANGPTYAHLFAALPRLYPVGQY